MEHPEEYVHALIDEMNHTEINSDIDTVYIGGGTPTALPSPLLCEILDAVKIFPLLPDVEITVEANPGTLTPSYLSALKSHGANRLSLGLQTTHPHLLRAISRIHTKADFIESHHAARAAGFANINIDLMFALPGQTTQEWHATLEEIIALAPQHISAYSLTPAENTPLWDALENNQLHLPSDEIDREMYHHARKILAQTGYIQYEISNFAKLGFESRHNINCWKRIPYIGFGLGAHSFDGKNRWHNTEDMAEYLHRAKRGAPHGRGGAERDSFLPHSNKKKDFQSLTESEALSESIILGLRLTNGIPAESIPSQFTVTIQRLITDGLLAEQNNNICLTPRGMDLANHIFTAFL